MLRYILNGVFNLDKDTIHDLIISVGIFLGKHELARELVKIIYDYNDVDISKTVDGIKYRTPFILSAGFDYNGKLSNTLPCIGLGGEEIGSITARPCAGNSKPRITYLTKSKSILVNKGLRNEGVDAIIKRLKNVPRTKINAADFVALLCVSSRPFFNIFLINYPPYRNMDKQLIPSRNILAGELLRAVCATRGPAMRP